LMVLVRGQNPLFDGTHSTVNVLDDATAAQLEVLRVALQPLFAILPLPRDQVVLLWTFTTQSIIAPLAALDAFPGREGLPTDVVVTAMATDLQTRDLPFPAAHLSAIVVGTFPSEDVIDHAQSRITFVPEGSGMAVQRPPGDPPTTLPF